MMRYSSFSLPIKYVITPYTPKLLLKNFTIFSSSIRMSVQSVIFGDKNIKKSNFYKNKKAFKIYDINVREILVSKEEQYSSKIHLNTLLDTMIMMAFDLYT